jgi:hypothetical protein
MRTTLTVLCLALLGTACATYQPLDVAVVGLEPLPSTVFEQRLRLDLRVLNPNDRDFDATGVSLRLSLNGQRLAQAVSSIPILVPRLGETRVQLEASTTLFDLARQLLVLRDRAEPLSYEVDGELHRSGLQPNLHFSTRGELSLGTGRGNNGQRP